MTEEQSFAGEPYAGSGVYGLLVTAVRLILGLEFAINGLNWWIKLIDPYPSLSDFVTREPPADVVGAMIKTGILFHVVKAVELAAGIALLSNSFVTLALVAVLPVTVNVFIVDVMLSNHLRAHIMGSGAMGMSLFLMLAYLRYYRPMLHLNCRYDTPQTAQAPAAGQPIAWLDPQASAAGRGLMTVFGLAALAIGLVMMGWVIVMIAQHFLGIP